MKIAVVEGRKFLLTPQLTLDRSVVADTGKSRKQLLAELAETVDQIRREAKDKGLDKMSKREINAAVAATRRGPKKAGKSRTK